MPSLFHRLRNALEGLLYDNTIEEEYYRKIRQKSSSSSAIIVGLVAAVGGFLYGYDTGLINDILEMRYVYHHLLSNGVNFNVHERALLTAVLSLGTFIGALVAPIISDNFGRKFSIVLSSALIFNVGNIFQVTAPNATLMCIGRAISGLSVGILSAIVPLYQAEASPKWVRGSIVYTYQWAITWGLLIASAICQGTRKLANSGSYRIPIGLQFLWSLTLCVGMLFLPESPRYFVQKNEIQKALASLSKLRRLPDDDEDLIEELVEIKANYDYELSFGKTTVLDCFRTGGGRHKQTLRIITGMGVHAFQQCSGINFIFYYGVNFFSSTGMKNFYLMSFVTYAVNTLFTIPGLVLIDIVGRRKLLLWGGCGMSISNFIIAIVGVCYISKEVTSIISISFLCVFIACFASSWGGVVWALASDIYGISIRQKAIAITAATNWLVNFVFAYITPYLIDTGSHTAALGNKIFFVWGGLNAIGVVFVYFTVYETKGLKLEEVDFMYQHCSNSRNSLKFKSGTFTNKKDNPNNPNTYGNDGIINNINDIFHNVNSTTSNSSSPDASHEKNLEVIEESKSQSSMQPQSGKQNIKMVPCHNNMLRPSFSSTEGEASESSSMNSQPINDYQRYLNSLLKGSTDSHYQPDTSQTSTSIYRDLKGPMQKYDTSNIPTPINNNGIVPPISIPLTTNSQIHTNGSQMSILGSSTTTNQSSTSQSNPITIIATPFFNSPPSDSDSEESDANDNV